MTDFNSLREDYKQATLDETQVTHDMFAQFRLWFDQAVASGLREPNAMTLATASPDGRPAARIVLLKGIEPAGFTFYTNYGSAKGDELAANPKAALVFYWNELERQVRIQGSVERVTRAENEKYFATRPLISRIGAIASPQSRVIADRAWLEDRMSELSSQFNETENQPACPEHWGGYRVIPEKVEFWQGRRSRLHDRLLYTRQSDGSWRIERLAP